MSIFLTRHPLFGDLSVIDFLLQGEITDQAVNVARLLLAISVNSTHGLGVVAGVPGGIEHHYTVGTN